MINTDPLQRVLVERELNLTLLSQLSGIDIDDLIAFSKSRKITKHNVEILCRILRCQPCDILEFTKTENKGHWEWVADSEK